VKILILGVNFLPELTGVGKYTGEMVEWLVAQGHHVHVVTAPPYYPAWQVDARYSAWRYGRESADCGRCIVWRCPIWVPKNVTGAKRLAHLASFAVTSFPVLLVLAFRRPDVVWVVAPSLMSAPAAWLVAKLGGARACIHIQDYEVDAAFDLGLLKNPRLRSLALAVERFVLRRFDSVSTISRRMLALARVKGVSEEKTLLFPNWVSLAAFAPPGAEEYLSDEVGQHGYREELSIPVDAVVALYSGNMGTKQGLEILPEVAALLAQGRKDVFFIFCGQGVGRERFEVLCAGLPNVRLLPLQPAERLSELLATADIHLLPQRADAADLVMPSKLTGMLASARPVVATAHPGTEVAEVVAQCGLVVPPEDAQALAEAIVHLADDAALRKAFGQAGREYAEQNLDRDVVLRRYEAELLRLCGQNRPSTVGVAVD
jgi:colanic acid biosynthesis glycosyl transferase WcaI